MGQVIAAKDITLGELKQNFGLQAAVAPSLKKLNHSAIARVSRLIPYYRYNLEKVYQNGYSVLWNICNNKFGN
jgi:hypothetical protein